MADFQFPELEDRTLPTILSHWAESAGDREYLQFGQDPAVTFLDVEVATNRIAHSLAGLGLTRGDRVAILAPNCLELVQTWFAAAKLGAVEVPVNTALRASAPTSS